MRRSARTSNERQSRLEVEPRLLGQQRDAERGRVGAAAGLTVPAEHFDELQELTAGAAAGQREPQRAVAANDAPEVIEHREKARRGHVTGRAHEGRLCPGVRQLVHEREGVCVFDSPAHASSSSWVAGLDGALLCRARSSTAVGSSPSIAGATERDASASSGAGLGLGVGTAIGSAADTAGAGGVGVGVAGGGLGGSRERAGAVEVDVLALDWACGPLARGGVLVLAAGVGFAFGVLPAPRLSCSATR